MAARYPTTAESVLASHATVNEAASTRAHIASIAARTKAAIDTVRALSMRSRRRNRCTHTDIVEVARGIARSYTVFYTHVPDAGVLRRDDSDQLFTESR